MMRLSKPQYSFEQTLKACIAGITGNAALQQKLIFSMSDLKTVEATYIGAAETGGLYIISPIDTDEDSDPVVLNTMRKFELVKIYDQYFVPEEKPARIIYDALLNSAKEECPFCGGIGTPRNLDHFLPKAHFPQFAVLPRNLVPACRDCNMGGKGQAFATNAEDQIIHPYADDDRFFLEQWIFATYHEGNEVEPGEFEYYTSPSEDWTAVDKQRVRTHFKDFNLAKRYAVKAAQQLGTVLQQIKCMERAGIDRSIIQNVLLQPGVDAAPFANHWQKGMYQALMHAIH